MRNILKIEEPLKRYYEELNKIDVALPSDLIIEKKRTPFSPKNDYSGLNSLRERLSATSNKNNRDPLNSEDDFLIEVTNYLLSISGDSPTHEAFLSSKHQPIYWQYIK